MKFFSIEETCFFATHPFSVVFDEELTVVGFGENLSKLIPSICRGDALNKWFLLERPAVEISTKTLLAHQGRLLVMKASNGAVLRGQVVALAEPENCYVFLCSPWLTSLSAMRELNLSLADLPVQDSIADYLILMNAKDAALKDSEALQMKLRAQMKEQRELERRLAISERLAAVGQLSAGVAHEINNPLAYMLANLSFIRESPLLLGDPDLEDLVKDVEIGAERIKKIVSDLLVFSRSEAEQEETIEDTSVTEVIERSVALVRREIEHRALLEIHCDAAIRVKGNRSRFEQVLVNLLINASHAIPTGDSSEHRIKVSAHIEKDRVVTLVQDSGKGISDEVLPRIFEPFYTTKPNGEGTGLGLSICHGIIRRMNGDIEVESTEGVGTTFKVILPCAPYCEEKSQAEKSHSVGSMQVLIVDDEEKVGMTLKRLLRNHECTFSSSPQEVVEMGSKLGRYDAIFCDLMMPNISGMEVYRRLSEVDQTLAERLIFMTGGAFTSEARAFLDEVANPRIAKPFDMDEIAEILAGKKLKLCA